MQVKIYLIMNRTNFKKYVGQTSRTLARRFWEHANNLKYAIGQAMQKYGIENFTIELIEVCETRKQANEREHYWIAFHDCIAPKGYNLTDGGGACAFSEQAHRNMSAGQKRRYSIPPNTRNLPKRKNVVHRRPKVKQNSWLPLQRQKNWRKSNAASRAASVLRSL
ncbi:MAG: GIY-YIG nuclease family protein [Selenomonadaceae bacterium]|nr:GIY-YIG nuclease family protein [Selenomonadaceae bacterium]